MKITDDISDMKLQSTCYAIWLIKTSFESAFIIKVDTFTKHYILETILEKPRDK